MSIVLLTRGKWGKRWQMLNPVRQVKAQKN